MKKVSGNYRNNCRYKSDSYFGVPELRIRNRQRKVADRSQSRSTGVSTAPTDTLQSLKRKFRDLEDRLGQMEGQVASGDFDLHRKFRDLDR